MDIAAATATATEMGMSPAKQAKMKAVAQEFESVFLSQLFSMMETDIDKDSPFSGGFSEELFKGELHAAMGKEVAKQGGVGIADAVYAQLLKYQEVQ